MTAVGFILMCTLYCDEMHQKVVLKNYSLWLNPIFSYGMIYYGIY
jgi:hypothetical protein